MTRPEEAPRRRVRSFVLRTGRMTPAQERAMAAGWPLWGLALEDGLIDPSRIFGRHAFLTLEIGFGMGQSLLTMAQAAPERDFIGVEVHPPGVGKLLHGIAEHGLQNLRVYCADAIDVLEQCIPEASLDCVQIFFPDPWHKKRHHKRRLIQPAFVELLRRRLRPGGTLHLATDWENYAEQMLATLTANSGLRNLATADGFVPRPDRRPVTRFEQRGARLGHGVWDLMFTREA